jgi:hypothetical protein
MRGMARAEPVITTATLQLLDFASKKFFWGQLCVNAGSTGASTVSAALDAASAGMRTEGGGVKRWPCTAGG